MESYASEQTSQSCGRYNLKIDGWMNVTSTDTEDFCRVGGCKEHTFAVLACICAVKSDIHFGNKATLQDLDHTIAHGCSHSMAHLYDLECSYKKRIRSDHQEIYDLDHLSITCRVYWKYLDLEQWKIDKQKQNCLCSNSSTCNRSTL